MFLPIQAAAVAALTGDQDCVYDTMKAMRQEEIFSVTVFAPLAGKWTVR